MNGHAQIPQAAPAHPELRVLMIADWFVYYLAPIAVAVSQSADVRCILRDDGLELGLEVGGAEHKAAMFSPVPIDFLGGKQFDLRRLGTLIRAIHRARAFKPNVIHSQWHSDWRLLAVSLALPRAVRILTVHDVSPHSGLQLHTHPLKRIVRQILYRTSRAFLVHGESLLPTLRKDRRVRKSACLGVVPHGSLAHPSSRHPLPARRCLLFFGRWEYYKGLDLLIEAVEQAAETIHDLRVVIAGQGSDGPRVRSLVRDPTLFVWHEGFIQDSELPALFASASAVILPYRDASQSGVIPLAFANGRPVIATNVGALGEVVTDGVNGLLVRNPVVSELRDAIVKIFGEPELLEVLADGARRTAAQTLGPEAIAQTHNEFYAKVLKTFDNKALRRLHRG